MDLTLDNRPLLEGIRCPGLTPGAAEILALADDIPKRLNIFYYKLAMKSLWIVFVGGTGTGKSTLFNAFCGKELSGTGLERPKTIGPIIFAHQNFPVDDNFPIPLIKIERRALNKLGPAPVTGKPNELLILEHDRKEWSHFVVADTPDLDSVEIEHRRVAGDLYLMSDLVVFITSQEKYADDVPYRFLTRIISEGRPYFFLLNKARGQITGEEVAQTLEGQGLSIDKDRIWIIPYSSAQPMDSISKDPVFRDFTEKILHVPSAEGLDGFRKTEGSRRAEELKKSINSLLKLLEEEEKAGKVWVDRLEILYQEACQDLLKEQKERFAAESKEYLQQGIRKLFARYDLLSKPRRIIRGVILAPFRLLGLGKERQARSSEEAIQKVQEKIDLSPVRAALEKFNRLVLEELSPSDGTASLYKKIRQPDVILTDREIKEKIHQEQVKLAQWLDDTFKELSQGIPKAKELGIYSTSILWGVLILSLETVIGGGFTILDAALDSALAPFVTRGAVELFAFNEIRIIAHELATRYQEGFLTVVHYQRDRYKVCLKSQMITREALESLESVKKDLEKKAKEM